MAGSPDVLTGTFAGRYTIERELGSGATATVYLARDTQRGINVAVKLLRPELAQSVGAERFLREIRLNEKLHHPHIVPVLDSGAYEGRLYFVLPLMEDGSLRHLLQREKQLPIDQAIEITRTVADALDYAHQQNLIHRDVKPENILFTSGQACLADFGIARAVERALDQSTTESGMVRGTPAYMSPEQASGSRQYDGRSDQYSLACVLYEMLAGVPAFIGPTPEAVIAQRFQHPPRELRVYRPTLPPTVDAVITKALSMSPADRYASVAEFAADLQTAVRPKVEARISGPSVTLTRGRVLAFTGAALAFVGIAAAIGGGVASTFRSRTPGVVNFVVPPPTGVQFADNLRDVSAVSPDGHDIIIAGTDSSGVRHLWRRPLSDQTATRIPGTDRGSKAFWSPDGNSIGFFRDRTLAVVGAAGGLARQLAVTAEDPRGGSWADNGTILFAPGTQSGIFGVRLTDTTSRQLTERRPERGEIGHMWPHALPGGRQFLYFVASSIDTVRGIYLGSVDSRIGRRIIGSSASGVYSDGHLLYVYGGALVAQRFDVASATLSGERRLIADSVATSYEYYGAFSASRDGVLVYAGGKSRDITRLTWMDTSGAVAGTASPQGYLRNPALSADGRYLAYETYRETDSDIRYVNLTTGASSVIPDDGAQSLDPVWSPDGSALAYIVERPGEWNVYRKFIDRPDPPELLFRSARYTVLTDWSAANALISVERSEGGLGYDVVERRIAAPNQPLVLAGGPGSQLAGRVSPDGRLLAYVSLEAGQPQVYVQRMGGARLRCQLSAGGGYQPTWGPKPGDLYFLTSNGTVMRAELDESSATPCGRALPRALFETTIRNPGQARSVFDVSQRTGNLLLNLPSTPDGAWLNVITKWTAAVPPAP